jgi:AcrR family transcriptional regulator
MSRTSRFDQDDAIAAGLAVVRRSGFESISLRAVAAALGVSPMALYRVVRDGDQLRSIIVDGTAKDLQPRVEASLEETLRAWADRSYVTLCSYPGVAGYVLVHWTELPGWLGIVDRLLAQAGAEGVEGPIAVGQVNAVFAFVLSRAQLHDSLREAPRRTLQLLDSSGDGFPFVRANRDQFVVAETDRHFSLGLTALLAGLHAVNDSMVIAPADEPPAVSSRR